MQTDVAEEAAQVCKSNPGAQTRHITRRRISHNDTADSDLSDSEMLSGGTSTSKQGHRTGYLQVSGNPAAAAAAA